MIHPTAVIHPLAILEDEIKIGKNTRVMEFAIIRNGVEIGDDCEIMERCILGVLPVTYSAFGRKEALFGVKLGDNVHLHTSATICAGTERPTTFGNNNVLGQLVTIGHDSRIGNRVMINNHSTLGGWVETGSDVLIHLNCTVRERIKIGSNVEVGMGSNVTKDIPSDCLVYGNPAQVIRRLEFGRVRKNFTRAVRRRLGLVKSIT